MKLAWSLASLANAEAIAALRNATADALAARHGDGPWAGHCTARGVLAGLRDGHTLIANSAEGLIATLRLGIRKPWAIDRAYFTKVGRPLYLSAMAVTPKRQRQGLGRLALEQASRVAREHGADAIFLDAYDAPAGAGGFYSRCGYRETGRSVYRGAALIYFELVL